MSPIQHLRRASALPIAVTLAIGILSTDDAAAQENAVNVTGSGSVEVTPDRARAGFAVETEADGAREAGEANAALMDRVITALRNTGIPELRIETSGYSLTPRYAPRQANEPQRIVGYTARNTVRVIVDDVDVVGRLVDTALGAGANRVAGISFEVRDPTPYRLEALRKAVEQAQSEAEVIAEALGMRLGDPASVQGGASFPQPRGYAMDDMMMRAEVAMAAPTPVEAGVQTVTANVTIRYRLHR